MTSTEYVQEARKQLEYALKREVRDEVRIWNVGMAVLAGGAALCGERVRPFFGLWALSLWDFGAVSRTAARDLYGLDENLRIAHMFAGSPAAAAGLGAGDVILSVGGLRIPKGGRARKRFESILQALGRRGSPVEFKVLRAGRELAFPVTPVPRCDYPVILISDEVANAYADGERIVLSQGLLRIVESDQHLAVFVGHELAHNTMKHRDAKKQNATVAGLGGLLLDIGFLALGVNTNAAFSEAAAKAGAQAYSVEFEQEADYVGLYALARSGYPLDGAAEVWRLMAAEDPISIVLGTTHPTAPERFVAIEKTIDEIKAKRAAGRPLFPELLTDGD